ncbi:MAG: hypothetical protein MK185_12065 [Saccharospirillaceae bacterium]|nr:hypothetical protein A3759_14265 [Thalassolituus sp. HI0120]MCH2041360.1 hypothetical protein [Saccharospirillaceae bacterium]
MTERFPDIEIYLMKAEAAAVKEWLNSALGEVTVVKAGTTCHWQFSGMDVFFTEQAEKNFSSLWFKQNRTPWLTDLDCARIAHAALGCEIRCSDSGWQEKEGDDQSGQGWIKLIRGEEKSFIWK